MERNGHVPHLDELVHRGLLRRVDPAIVDAVLLRSLDDGGIERIEDDLLLTVEHLVVRPFGSPLDQICIVEQHAHVADPSNA